jgi:hypothetical protein
MYLRSYSYSIYKDSPLPVFSYWRACYRVIWVILFYGVIRCAYLESYFEWSIISSLSWAPPTLLRRSCTSRRHTPIPFHNKSANIRTSAQLALYLLPAQVVEVSHVNYLHQRTNISPNAPEERILRLFANLKPYSIYLLLPKWST